MTAEPQVVDVVVEHIDWLVTVDEERRVIRDAAVAIADGRFAAVGKTDEIAAAYTGSTVVDGRRRVATPGFIDAHLHSSFQLSRGLADEANAREFLIQRMYPYEAALTPDDVELSARLAAREMLLHGTTCFVDPGNNHPERSLAGVVPTGIRVVVARSAFDLGDSAFGSVPDSMVSTPDSAAREAADLVDKYHDTEGGRVRASVSFRGFNNSSDELIRALGAVADDKNVLLQTHACFNYSTHDASVAKFGRPEIERMAELELLGPRTLLVHGGWLEPHEVALLAEHYASIVAAPSSSLHNGYGNIRMGVIPELLALDVNVGLGSDHACSGPVDLVREMFLVACGHKEVRLNPRVLPPEQAVEMATVNGALAVDAADDLGAVAVGKQADLVLFDVDDPSWQPLYNPVSNLVYSATGRTARDVFVAGERVVEGGRLARVDEERLLADVTAGAAALYDRLDGDSLVRGRWPVS